MVPTSAVKRQQGLFLVHAAIHTGRQNPHAIAAQGPGSWLLCVCGQRDSGADQGAGVDEGSRRRCEGAIGTAGCLVMKPATSLLPFCPGLPQGLLSQGCERSYCRGALESCLRHTKAGAYRDRDLACQDVPTECHTCVCSPSPPEQQVPKGNQAELGSCGGGGFYSIRMQISWHSERVGKLGAEEEHGRELGGGEEKNHKNKSCFYSSFLPRSPTPLWVDASSSLMIRAAWGFWTSPSISEHFLNTCHVPGAEDQGECKLAEEVDSRGQECELGVE